MSAPAKIAISGLTLDHEDSQGRMHRAVEHLDLDIRPGELLCVVGPSGCGKSTLISAIGGFLPARAGSITMNGRAITGPGPDRGVVFQEYALLPWRRVIDNVALGLKIKGVPRAERLASAQRFLDLVGLGAVGRKYPHELSGGMKQRAAVARTLANAPEVVLMDEPFAAIDAQNRMILQEELLRLWETLKLTVLFVTHSVEEAVFLADRVAVLTPGPGRVAAIVDVPIPRATRHWSSIGSDPQFIALRDQVVGIIRGAEPASLAPAT